MKIIRTLVLDLDECIIHTPFEYSEKTKRGWKKEDFKKLLDDRSLRGTYKKYSICDPNHEKVCNCTTLFRPYFNEFLCSIRNFFDIFVIWTAGSYGYAHNLIDHTFPRDNRCLPDIIWTRENQNKPDNKELRLLWNKHPEINPDYTFHLDNMVYNFTQNPSHGILIPDFEPNSYEEFKNSNDDFLKRCLDYFKSLKFKKSVHEQDLYFLFSKEERKKFEKQIQKEQEELRKKGYQI